jgi:hypothetical protein
MASSCDKQHFHCTPPRQHESDSIEQMIVTKLSTRNPYDRRVGFHECDQTADSTYPNKYMHMSPLSFDI